MASYHLQVRNILNYSITEREQQYGKFAGKLPDIDIEDA